LETKSSEIEELEIRQRKKFLNQKDITYIVLG